MANRASFLPLTAYIRALGVRQTLSFNYSSKNGIEQAALELRDYLQKHVRGGRIDLVCHSLGGVIARVYLQELGGARRVDRCITLGTPHKGTYNSYWIRSRIGHELRPDSPIIKRLEVSRERAATVKFTSIIGGSDTIIIPPASGLVSEDQVVIPFTGHVGLLFSGAVFRCVAQRLLADCEELQL